MDHEIHFVSALVDCLANISFSAIENSYPALVQHLSNTSEGVLISLPFTIEQTIFSQTPKSNCIYELHTAIGLQYLIYIDQVGDQILVLGPSLMKQNSEAVTRQSLNRLRLPQKTVDKIINHFANLPVLSSNLMIRAFLLLIEHLTGNNEHIEHKTFDLYFDYAQPHPTQAQDDALQMRQVESRYEVSTSLTEAVKQGNVSFALQLLNHYAPKHNADIRNANPLRNIQNYCIVLNTQLRHALEENGIHPYRLDKLSNEIGVGIEQLTTMEHAQDYFVMIIQKYCKLVHEHSYPHLRPLVHLAVTYIKEHLNEDLSVKGTARILGVNPNYLSTQFHHSMGIPFIDFMHQERIKQATALLDHTNLQIQQIASAVGYNNTSYFSKQFMRFHGTNPSQYRKKSTH